jgi:chromosome segregation ATPase
MTSTVMYLFLAAALAADPATALSQLIAEGERLVARLEKIETERDAVRQAERELDRRERDLNDTQLRLNEDVQVYQADSARNSDAIKRFNAECRGTLTESAMQACGAQRSALESEDARLKGEPARIQAEQARLPPLQTALQRDVAAWNERNLAHESLERELEYDRSDWSAKLNDVLTTSAWADKTKGVAACAQGANLTSDVEYFRQTLAELSACRDALRK